MPSSSPVEGEGDCCDESRTEVCRGAKPLCRGFGGVPQFPSLPPRVGDRGLNESHQCPSQTTRSVANSNDKALDCARLFIDASIRMMIGQTH